MCRELHCQSNLKFNTLSLIMSIGVVQSPWEGLGKEYDGSLFKFANSSDLWGAKGNGRSVFRNYSMLHEWCGNVHVYVSLKILEWDLVNCRNYLEKYVWKTAYVSLQNWSDLKSSSPSASLIFLIVSYARIVLHEDFDSYLSKLSINVTTPH